MILFLQSLYDMAPELLEVKDDKVRDLEPSKYYVNVKE